MNKFDVGDNVVISKKDLFNSVQSLMYMNVVNVHKMLFNLVPNKIMALSYNNTILYTDEFKVKKAADNKIVVNPGIAYVDENKLIVLKKKTVVTVPTVNGIYNVYIGTKTLESITGLESFNTNMSYATKPTVNIDDCAIIVTASTRDDLILLAKIQIYSGVLCNDSTSVISFEGEVGVSGIDVTFDRPEWMSSSFQTATLSENDAIEQVTFQSSKNLTRAVNNTKAVYFRDPLLTCSPVIDMRHLSCCETKIYLYDVIKMLDSKSSVYHTHAPASDLDEGLMSSEMYTFIDGLLPYYNNLLSLSSSLTWKDNNNIEYAISKTKIPQTPYKISGMSVSVVADRRNTSADFIGSLSYLMDKYILRLSWVAPTKQKDNTTNLTQVVTNYAIKITKVNDVVLVPSNSVDIDSKRIYERNYLVVDYSGREESVPSPTTYDIEIDPLDKYVVSICAISETGKVSEPLSDYFDVSALIIGGKTVSQLYTEKATEINEIIRKDTTESPLSKIPVVSITGEGQEHSNVRLSCIINMDTFLQWEIVYKFGSGAEITEKHSTSVILIPKPSNGDSVWGSGKTCVFSVRVRAVNPYTGLKSEWNGTTSITQTITMYNYINTNDLAAAIAVSDVALDAVAVRMLSEPDFRAKIIAAVTQ